MTANDLIHKYFKGGREPKAVYHAGRSPEFEAYIKIMACLGCNVCAPCSELNARGYITVRLWPGLRSCFAWICHAYASR